MDDDSIKLLKAFEIVEKAEITKTDFSFKSILLVRVQAIKIASNKKPYLDLKMQDITGSIRKVRKWSNNGEEHIKDREIFDIGNVVEIEATFDKGYNSVTINKYKLLENHEYAIEDFIKPENVNAADLIRILDNVIYKIKNPYLKLLLEKIFHDKDIRKKFIDCPSSIEHHHSYKHGNLQHTIGMIKTFEELEKFYEGDTFLNVDLVHTGILLHDIAKIEEYSIYNGVPKYISSDLSHHTDIGKKIIIDKIKEIDDFPKYLENQICNIISSHHGKKEWDSLELPLTNEAEVVHNLDMIDSRFKLNS
ncbi:MAG: HD domain-containing protein [Candidatus Lokiarchaeota archaeon]|nr:HD domain-containing protein [Candidatus Lokiarchaeota archaeon]